MKDKFEAIRGKPRLKKAWHQFLARRDAEFLKLHAKRDKLPTYGKRLLPMQPQSFAYE